MHHENVLAELCSAFATLTLTIARVGLYGTMSYSVAQRAGEIGIRMALGAERRAVIWMVLREVLVLAGVGLAIGVPVAIGVSMFVQSLLFGLKPHDPLTISTGVAILLSAGVVAAFLPAWKASRIDPMAALQHE